jgi:membrane protease YdiL (CAAX protease family)
VRSGSREQTPARLTGLVFALVYVWRQSLVAPVVMHLVFNLLAIVVAPLLSP